MTIKILGQRGDIPANSIITLDPVTEAALIASGQATATLTGGVVWVPPGNSPPAWPSPLNSAEASATRVAEHVGSLNLRISAFRCGNYSHPGGMITLPGPGTWFVGVEFWSGAIRVLPRLGHRGWIPVGRFVVSSGLTVTESTVIRPELPTNRIPRTTAKLLAKQPVTIAIIGSSLLSPVTSGDPRQTWIGMLTDTAALPTTEYRLSSSVLTVNALAQGSAGNAFGMAQTGRVHRFISPNADASGWQVGISDLKAAPIGRHQLLSSADLVIVGCLANTGDNYLDLIEPQIRNLRKMGCEVILVTDNPQNPTTDYSTMQTAPLYVDGQRVMDIAELYGCELADTAGYMFEAQIRNGGVGVYEDTIHPSNGPAIAGPLSVAVACGEEAWARAIRSVFSVSPMVATSVSRTWDWSVDEDGATNYAPAYSAISVADNKITSTKTSASAGVTGVFLQHFVGAVIGDMVRIQGVVEHTNAANNDPQVGSFVGTSGWGVAQQRVPASPGSAFDISMRITADAPSNARGILYNAWNAAPDGNTVSWSNVTVTYYAFSSGSIEDPCSGRAVEVVPVPPRAAQTALTLPGDAWVTFPVDEHYIVTNAAEKGTVGANLFAASSFPRRWSSAVGSSQDLLTLATNKRAAWGAYGAVGFGIIRYADTQTATVQVYRNGALVKTLTFSSITPARSTFDWILTPTEMAVNSATPAPRTVEIRITAGAVKAQAFVSFTSEYDIIRPADIEFSGTWSAALQAGGANGLLGRSTGELNAYARARQNWPGKRVWWITSSNVNSKPINTWGGSTLTAAEATVGANQVAMRGGHIDHDSGHFVQCAQAFGPGDGTDGYALHVAGALAVIDR